MPDNDVAFTGKWTINTYTVAFYDGQGNDLSRQTVDYGQSATAPPNPTRPGYVFAGWNKTFNNITGDLTVTAQWIPYWNGTTTPQTPAPTQTTPTTPTTPVNTVTPTPTPTVAPPQITPTPTPQSPAPTQITPTPAPKAPAPPVPISSHHWSLLSCMMSVAAVLTAVLLLVFMYFRKREYEKYADELDGQNLLTDDRKDALDDLRKKGRAPKVLAIIAGIVTLIVWLILDLPLIGMVWIDYSTPWVALVFIITMILTLVFNIRKKHPDDAGHEADGSAPTYVK